jgi:hypothetical protein
MNSRRRVNSTVRQLRLCGTIRKTVRFVLMTLPVKTLRAIAIRVAALLSTLVFALTVSLGVHIYRYRQANFAEAAFRGDFFRMKVLYHLGVNVNAAGCPYRNCFTPLWGAAYGGHDDEIRFLLERGADVNGKTNFDSTALMVAAYKRRELTVRLLREAGARDTP